MARHCTHFAHWMFGTISKNERKTSFKQTALLFRELGSFILRFAKVIFLYMSNFIDSNLK